MQSDLHYRVFAKLILVLAILLGGGIGYFSGVEVGEANALRLINAGREAANTTTDADTKSDSTDPKVIACYEETLGAERYAKIADGTSEFTVDEIFKILPCTNLE